jgi:hypothetical protein
MNITGKYKGSGKCYGKKISTNINTVEKIQYKGNGFYEVNVSSILNNKQFKEVEKCVRTGKELICVSTYRSDKHWPVLEKITFVSPNKYIKVVQDLNKLNPNVCKLHYNKIK